MEWEKDYGGTVSERARTVFSVPGGGYLFFGYTSSPNGDIVGNHGGSDEWIVKGLKGAFSRAFLTCSAVMPKVLPRLLQKSITDAHRAAELNAPFSASKHRRFSLLVPIEIRSHSGS